MAERDQSHSSNRGFASMDDKKQRDIASKGGQASSGNFKNDPERASEAGRKGGQSVPAEERSFSRDHELASEAGRKGGERSHGGQVGGSHQGGGHQRGHGDIAEDRDRAPEDGRKDGEHGRDRR